MRTHMHARTHAHVRTHARTHARTHTHTHTHTHTTGRSVPHPTCTNAWGGEEYIMWAGRLSGGGDQHCHTGGHEDAEPSLCTHDRQGLLIDLWLHMYSSKYISMTTVYMYTCTHSWWGLVLAKMCPVQYMTFFLLLGTCGYTAKSLITDPPKSGQPLYSRRLTCPRLILP